MVFISILLIPYSSSAQSSTLRISKSGAGGGTITSSPQGIDCGSDCTEIYSTDTKPINVTLSAKVDSISYFAGWGGACTGTKPKCTLAMDSDKDVIANFAPNPILTITKAGDGKGTIKSAPSGVNCGIDCAGANAQYKYKLRVTLTVKADLYSTFLGWGGDCQARGIRPTCTITVDSDKTVTTSFGLPDISVSPSAHDFGSVGKKQSSDPTPFTIRNGGIGNLKVESIQIIGTDKKTFKMSGSKGHVIPPGGNYQFTMTFKPTSTGLKNATLQITSNDPDTSLIEIPISGFACTDKPKVTICKGTIEQCLSVKCGWKFDEKAVSDPDFCDASVVRLPDGRYRMYGNSTTQLPNGRAIDSWISEDGIVFEKEPGFRLISPGGFLPFVVMLPDGRFRMYYTDQSVYIGFSGARAIKSAISTDGLNFVTEDGDRLTYLDNEYEAGGIRGAKILVLKDGTYRMYYVAIKDNVGRGLSAVSSDGLNWVREQGVRIDPQILCPANPDIGPSDPFIDSNGIIHQYIWTVTCRNQSWQGAVAGLFDFTSVDGLTFSIGSEPIISGYYFKDLSTGKPADPGARADNAPVIMTPEGLRAYLFMYCPRFDLSECTDWPEMGYYSVLNPNIR
jgi:hypothetical protein